MGGSDDGDVTDGAIRHSFTTRRCCGERLADCTVRRATKRSGQHHAVADLISSSRRRIIPGHATTQVRSYDGFLRSVSDTAWQTAGDKLKLDKDATLLVWNSTAASHGITDQESMVCGCECNA